jgi:hypothetical protein
MVISYVLLLVNRSPWSDILTSADWRTLGPYFAVASLFSNGYHPPRKLARFSRSHSKHEQPHRSHSARLFVRAGSQGVPSTPDVLPYLVYACYLKDKRHDFPFLEAERAPQHDNQARFPLRRHGAEVGGWHVQIRFAA